MAKNPKRGSLSLVQPDGTPNQAYDKKKVYRLMVKARALEERMIKMSKSSDGYFWIGGPGEEAFSVPLGLLTKKGEGLDYDYLHFHYRNSGTVLAMGGEMIDTIRQMASKSTDPYSGGRNFTNHYAIKKWNVSPVSPTIETQYSIAPGTALAQLRHGGDAITIVTGGDAGTAEGDFWICLNWSTRPGRELPILIIVMNNQYGISTPYGEVQGSKTIAQRAEPFGIATGYVDGNDPEASFEKIKEAMEYVRKNRRPYCLEAKVSRLYGHSSSSGALRVQGEIDCIEEYEKKLIRDRTFSKDECEQIKKEYTDEAFEALKTVREEPDPQAEDIWNHIFKE